MPVAHVTDRPTMARRIYLRFLGPSVADHDPDRYWRARLVDWMIVVSIVAMVALIVYMAYRSWGEFIR
jgi:hypothetical protein